MLEDVWTITGPTFRMCPVQWPVRSLDLTPCYVPCGVI